MIEQSAQSVFVRRQQKLNHPARSQAGIRHRTGTAAGEGDGGGLGVMRPCQYY